MNTVALAQLVSIRKKRVDTKQMMLGTLLERCNSSQSKLTKCADNLDIYKAKKPKIQDQLFARFSDSNGDFSARERYLREMKESDATLDRLVQLHKDASEELKQAISVVEQCTMELRELQKKATIISEMHLKESGMMALERVRTEEALLEDELVGASPITRYLPTHKAAKQ